MPVPSFAVFKFFIRWKIGWLVGTFDVVIRRIFDLNGVDIFHGADFVYFLYFLVIHLEKSRLLRAPPERNNVGRIEIQTARV